MCLHKQALKCVFANEYSFQKPRKVAGWTTYGC